MHYYFREVVLGEHVIGTNFDCTTSNSGKKMCAPKRIVRGVAKALVHDDYKVKGRSIIVKPNENDNDLFTKFPTGIGSRNDIALLRLDESVPLNSENPTMSLVSPICLPWSKDKPAKYIHKGNKTLLTGWGHVTNNRWDRIDNAKRL